MADLVSAINQFGASLSGAGDEATATRDAALIGDLVSPARTEQAMGVQQQQVLLQNYVNQKASELAVKYQTGKQQIAGQDFYAQAAFIDEMLTEMKIDPKASVMEQKAQAYLMANPKISGMWNQLNKLINSPVVSIVPMDAKGERLETEDPVTKAALPPKNMRDQVTMGQLLARARSGNIQYAYNIIHNTPAGPNDQLKKQRANDLGLVYLSPNEDPKDPTPRVLNWLESKKWKQDGILAAKLMDREGISEFEARERVNVSNVSAERRSMDIATVMAENPGLSMRGAETLLDERGRRQANKALWDESMLRITAVAQDHPQLMGTSDTAAELTALWKLGPGDDYNNAMAMRRAYMNENNTPNQKRLGEIVSREQEILEQVARFDPANGAPDIELMENVGSMTALLIGTFQDEAKVRRILEDETDPRKRMVAERKAHRMEQMAAAVNGSDPKGKMAGILEKDPAFAEMLSDKRTVMRGQGGMMSTPGGVTLYKTPLQQVDSLDMAFDHIQRLKQKNTIGYEQKQGGLGSLGAYEALLLRAALNIADTSEHDGAAAKAMEVVGKITTQEDSYALDVTGLDRATAFDHKKKLETELRDLRKERRELESQGTKNPALAQLSLSNKEEKIAALNAAGRISNKNPGFAEQIVRSVTGIESLPANIASGATAVGSGAAKMTFANQAAAEAAAKAGEIPLNTIVEFEDGSVSLRWTGNK